MFIMPMTANNASGGGTSHEETMLGDNEWHYEEYHRDEFDNWWGAWNWEETVNLVIGVWETNERGPATMWYDHVMLFNNPGEGRIDFEPSGIDEWSLY